MSGVTRQLSASTVFDYAVTPDEVYFSDGSADPPRWSVVTLTIQARNPSAGDVPCSGITFVAGSGFGAQALTEDPSTIETAPGDVTPWSIGGGAGTWTAVPLPPSAGLAAGETVSFALSNVFVNSSSGSAEIEVREDTDQRRSGRLAVRKRTRVPPQPAPVIRLFTAQPDRVAQGDQVVLSWRTDHAELAAIAPAPGELRDPASGSVTVSVRDSANFELTASGTGGLALAQAMVIVMPVTLESFTASPAGLVAPGAEVLLRWTTRYAVSCAIDQGIGPVPRSGEWRVRPARTTVYTLSAAGRASRSASVTVTVAPPGNS
jgi:hypothetical protein